MRLGLAEIEVLARGDPDSRLLPRLSGDPTPMSSRTLASALNGKYSSVLVRTSGVPAAGVDVA